DAYLHLLADDHQAPEQELPSTGVSLEWEKALSAAFIRTEHYGTRSSTILRVRQDGNYEMVERRFDANGMIAHDVITGNLIGSAWANYSV
ncbi:MAG: hypothetical protein RLZZ145_43, partial [Pseudomonadota bacterium]